MFILFPDTEENYFDYSQYLRDQAAATGEKIPILDFEGRILADDPATDNVQEISFKELDSFGPFGIMKELIFPDEEHHLSANEKDL